MMGRRLGVENVLRQGKWGDLVARQNAEDMALVRELRGRWGNKHVCVAAWESWALLHTSLWRREKPYKMGCWTRLHVLMGPCVEEGLADLANERGYSLGNQAYCIWALKNNWNWASKWAGVSKKWAGKCKGRNEQWFSAVLLWTPFDVLALISSTNVGSVKN